MINDVSFYVSIVTAVFIGGIAGYLGSLMITRHMSLVSGPLGHLALPGVALGIVYNIDIFWGALATIAVGSLLIWLIDLRAGRLSVDTITAVVFSSAVAIGFLLLPLEQAERALVGDITQVTAFDALLAVGISVIFFFIVRRVYFSLLLSDISESLALSHGIHTKRYSFLYMVAIAMVVAIEVKIVGILLTAALMAIPAAAANNISRSFSQYRISALIIGSASALIGVLVHRMTDLTAGPLMILIAACVFFMTLPFAKRC